MSNIKKIVKNTAWISIAEVVGKIVAFVALIFITRYLTREAFGQYTFVLSFGLIFGVLANFGFGAFTTREIAKNKSEAKKMVGNLLSLKALFSLVVLVLIVVFAQFLDKPVFVITAIYVVGFLTIFDAFRSFLSSIFQAYEEMQYISVLRIGERVLYVGLILAVISLNKGIVFLVSSAALSSFIFSLIGLWFVHRKFVKLSFRFDKNLIKKVLLATFYFVVNDIFIVVFFKIDTVMLSLLKGDEVTGVYNAAYNFVYAAIFVPAVLSTVLYPVLTRFYNEKVELFKNNISLVLKYYFLASVPIVLFLFLFAGDLLSFIYKGKYDDALQVFQLLSVGILFVFMNFILSTMLNTVEKQKLVAIASFVAMVLNLGLNFVFIPEYGVMGAAGATLITEAVFCLGLLCFLHTQFSVLSGPNIWKLFKVVVAFSVVIVFYVIFEPSVYVFYPLFIFAFLLLLFVFGVFGEKDKQYLLEALPFKKK